MTLGPRERKESLVEVASDCHHQDPWDRLACLGDPALRDPKEMQFLARGGTLDPRAPPGPLVLALRADRAQLGPLGRKDRQGLLEQLLLNITDQLSQGLLDLPVPQA